jgi:hypothetical protein
MEQNEKTALVKAEMEKRMEEERADRKTAMIKYWNELKPFKTPGDVPTIPRVDEKEYKEFYVPRLIAAGAIPKVDLIDGQCYVGDYRNARIGKWNAKENVFEHWRYKFGFRLDTCNHFENDNGFALFVPIGLATQEDFDNKL